MGRAATGVVRKLPSGRYQARFTFPDGVRRPAPSTFQTKRDATAWINQQAADVSRGVWKREQHAASMNTTFSDFAERWLANRTVKGRSIKPRTRAGYRDLLDRFIYPEFGREAIHAIDRDAVERWYQRTAVDTPTYRARAYSLLRTILHSAVDEGHVAINPARIRGAGRAERKHVIRPATKAELRVIVDAMPPRYGLLIELAAWCALRYGELTELRRADVDTRDGVLRVRRAVSLVNGEFVVDTPKTAAGVRDIVIPPHLMPAVRAHLLEHTAPGLDGLLFPSKNDPTEHLRQSSLARVYYPARAKAERSDLRFHDLRHTGLSKLAAAGATIAELQDYAGHANAAAVMIYSHVLPGRRQSNAARLSDMAAGEG